MWFYEKGQESGPTKPVGSNSNSNVKNAYLHSLAIDDPLALQQGEQIYYYHKDGLGSITEITDVSGNTIGTYGYNSFGAIILQSGNLNQPFMFTAREFDPESGLYYYRARYYDPRAGRFLTKDPIGFAGGDVNLYRYVINNPVNLIDPLGLTWLTYDAGTNNLYVYPGTPETQGPPRAFPAGNITDSTSLGPIPIGGPYDIGEPIPNTGDRADRIPSQGPYFIPIYGVDGRTELGIHGGRTGPEYPTMGCIRMSNQNLVELVNIHRGDPMTTITVINSTTNSTP